MRRRALFASIAKINVFLNFLICSGPEVKFFFKKTLILTFCEPLIHYQLHFFAFLAHYDVPGTFYNTYQIDPYFHSFYDTLIY